MVLVVFGDGWIKGVRVCLRRSLILSSCKRARAVAFGREAG